MIRLILFLLPLLFTLSSAAQRPGEVLPECRNAAEERQRTERFFTQQEISDAVFRRMKGRSFGKGCTVKRSDLRYLLMLHRNVEGLTQVGEMVCNKAIARDLLTIFRRLYEGGYRIERMVLIDDYDADDDRSMSANNTSCFNFRPVTGSRSRHGHGGGHKPALQPLCERVRGKAQRLTTIRPQPPTGADGNTSW